MANQKDMCKTDRRANRKKNRRHVIHNRNFIELVENSRNNNEEKKEKRKDV